MRLCLEFEVSMCISRDGGRKPLPGARVDELILLETLERCRELHDSRCSTDMG